jgi:UDP-N-acetylmuramoyl-L-alanyl-D-glutamate--2,6-diaminopimelate ligase
MELSQLLAGVPGVEQITDAAGRAAGIDITRITADSRLVVPGALFVAYRGVGVDGHRFIHDAVARGAAAVVGERPAAELWAGEWSIGGSPTPYIQVPDGRAAVGWLNAAWYGHPSRSMPLVGITGTDGKTTTANLLYSILQVAGRRAGLISTVNAVIGGQLYDTGLHTTTPDAPDVQRYLAQMRDAGSDVAVLEVTSHGLAQQRVAGCAFDVAVVTNITHEHLDFHGSYEEYRAAKAMLFRGLVASSAKPGVVKTSVLNRDDGAYAYLADIPVSRTITYGLSPASYPASGGSLALTAGDIAHTPTGTRFELRIEGDRSVSSCRLTTALVGDFNVSNILAAAGAALALGVDRAHIVAGVAAMQGIPGRMERINAGQPFTAIVDFAHTPNALTQALTTVRTLAGPQGRVIAVFGCAGLRDVEKRQLMGEAAARLADYTVITAEDPRTEDLPGIMGQTAAAMTAMGRVAGRDFLCVADRQRALLHAVQSARPGDVVIACGKGHEQSMCFGTEEYPWREQDALRWALGTVLAKPDASPVPPNVLPTW